MNDSPAFQHYIRKIFHCGFDIYLTEDGMNFTKITDDGFGESYNHGLWAFDITDKSLYIGTANPFCGTQVWQLREED